MDKIVCNRCGNLMEVPENEPVVICSQCGNVQVVAARQDVRKNKLQDQADSLLAQREFDRAEEVYRTILQEFPETAAAYWGLVLCTYGVEYVKETGNTQEVPVLLRSSRHPVTENPDYLKACALASTAERRMYQNEAERFEELRRKYQAISEQEKPYDIFISYKESDENGGRTKDSVIGQTIYEELTKKGYRVFFSRITLKKILGQEYEPYIFAALHSAKIMLVLGTQSKHYTSAWVKNEWGRYLKLMDEGGDRCMIPCYLSVNRSDMPEPLKQQNCQDLAQKDAVQQLLQVIAEKVGTRSAAYAYDDSDPEGPAFLLKSGQMALEDGSWDKAVQNFEKVLVLDNQSAPAYLGKVLAEQQVSDLDQLAEKRLAETQQAQAEDCQISEDQDRIQAAVSEFASPDGLSEDRVRELFRFEETYSSTVSSRHKQLRDEKRTWEKNKFLQNALQYSAPDRQIEIRKTLDRIYTVMEERLREAQDAELDARAELEADYGDFLAQAEDQARQESQEAESANREMEQRRKQRQEKEKKHTKIKIIAIVSLVLTLVLAAVIGFFTVRYRISSRYSEAEAAMARGDYEAAAEIYESFHEEDKIRECRYAMAQQLEQEGKPLEAAMMYGKADHYKDSFDKSTDLWAPYLQLDQLAQSESYMGGIRRDGMVFMKGDTTLFGSTNAIHNWTDIVDIDMGKNHTICLNSEGRVQYNGKRRYGKPSGWENVVDVAAGRKHTVTLSKFGGVKAKGFRWNGQCRVKKWEDVVAIDCGDYYTLGLRNDGTVYYAGRGREEVSGVRDWENICRISAGPSHTVGLQADGTVVAVGDNADGRCRVENWTDMIDVGAGLNHTVGLHSDGTVVAIGDNTYGQCNVSDWTDVVYIYAADRTTYGVQSDGTILVAGRGYGYGDEDPATEINALKNGAED